MPSDPATAAGYSGTPLIRKLGVSGMRPAVVMNPPCPYDALLGEPVDIDILSSAEPVPMGCAYLHLFTTIRAEMEAVLTGARHRIAPTGMIWISWPKRSAKVPTDITEDVIREVCLPMGYVDIKVCAVDAVWSGLKLVIRKDLR
jgi:hypothetical protein